MNKGTALVILSGGQDSTTCLYIAKEQFNNVEAIFFDYNQKHIIEKEAAKKIANMAGVPLTILTLGDVFGGDSPLTTKADVDQLKELPDHSSSIAPVENTFVPGRNMLFLTLAASFAYGKGITHLFTGVSQEDYGGYPDCEFAFISSCQETLRAAMKKEFCIHTPLIHMSKKDSIYLAMKLKGCMEAMAYTHTSYDGNYPPTGRDHATLLRARGFEQAGVPDPLVVRANKEGLMKLPATQNYDSIRSKK